MMLFNICTCSSASDCYISTNSLQQLDYILRIQKYSVTDPLKGHRLLSLNTLGHNPLPHAARALQGAIHAHDAFTYQTGPFIRERLILLSETHACINPK